MKTPPTILIRYSANGLYGELILPSAMFRLLANESLAELAAADHWKFHAEEIPTDITTVNLQGQEGNDMGLFEVRCEQRQIFTAVPLRQA
jgi:hypothetical protein